MSYTLFLVPELILWNRVLFLYAKQSLVLSTAYILLHYHSLMSIQMPLLFVDDFIPIVSKSEVK